MKGRVFLARFMLATFIPWSLVLSYRTRISEVKALPDASLFHILGQVPPSPTILASPILLFTGAGASAPLGKLLMNSFVDKLSAQVREKDPGEMLDLLKGFRGNDLEAIMGELDVLIGLEYASSISGYRTFSSGGYAPFNLEPQVAKRLQSLIKHAVIREYRDVDAGQTVKLYEPVFDSIFSRLDASKQCLVIFTTNYDPAIESFCEQKYDQYHICDGFAYNQADRHHYWHRSVFDNFQLVPEKRNIVLFKIHGSVDWMSVKALNKIRRVQAMYDQMDSDAYSNVLIYPATRKIATDEPFYSGYEYF